MPAPAVCVPVAFSIRTNGRIEFGDPAAFRFCANIDAPWRDAIALALYAALCGSSSDTSPRN